MYGLSGQLLRRLGADEGLHQRVDDGAHRHAQQHAQHAEGAAADGDGRQHPQSRQAHGLAHHPGINEVALHLLEDQQEDQERQGLDGTLEHDEKRAGGRADPRAENGDQRQRRDDHRHRQGVGQAQDQHAQAAQGAQDERLRHLTGDEAGKGVVGEAQQRQQAVGGLPGQDAAQQPLGLGDERLLLGQQVQGEHQRQQEVHQCPHDGGGDVQGGVHHAVALLLQEAGDGLLHVLRVEGQLRQGHAVLRREIAEVRPPRLDLGHIGGDVGHHGGARLLQTGDEDEEDGKDDAQEQHHGQRQADGTLQLTVPRAVPLDQRPVPQPLQRRHHQVQHKGDADTDEQGRQQGQQAGEHVPDGRDVVQAPEQQHREGDEQHDALHCLFVQIHGDPPF